MDQVIFDLDAVGLYRGHGRKAGRPAGHRVKACIVLRALDFAVDQPITS